MLTIMKERVNIRTKIKINVILSLYTSFILCSSCSRERSEPIPGHLFGPGWGRDGKNTENPSRLSILLPWFIPAPSSLTVGRSSPGSTSHYVRRWNRVCDAYGWRERMSERQKRWADNSGTGPLSLTSSLCPAVPYSHNRSIVSLSTWQGPSPTPFHTYTP